MANTQEIKQRIGLCARELSEEFGEVDDSDALSWLDAVETQAVAIGDAVTAELVKQKSADRPVENESTCPKCGKLGRYKGQRPRVFNWRRSSRRRETSKRSPKQRFPASGSSVGRSGLATSASPRSKSKPRRIKNFRCPIVGEVLLTRFRKSRSWLMVWRRIGACIANTSPTTRQFSTSRTPCTASMQRRLQGSRWGMVGVSTASGPSGYGRMQMTS